MRSKIFRYASKWRLKLRSSPSSSRSNGVGVLHDELAHAQQARLRPRLVAELALELEPDLGELLVGPHLAREVGEDLFVGHTQAHVGAAPVLQAEQLVAHGVPATAALPQFRRMQARQLELLRADLLQLVADDARDLAAHPLTERQQRVAAGHQLTDQARAHEQLVAGRLRVGRVVAKCGNEAF